MELPKNYDFKEAESRLRTVWEEQGIYRFNPENPEKIYSIDTPPPTVSGKMHIGHAFSYAQQDFIVRFKRMQGMDVFERQADGLILLMLLKHAIGEYPELKKINTGVNLSIFKKNENLNLFLRLAEAEGCHLVNIGSNDISSAR